MAPSVSIAAKRIFLSRSFNRSTSCGTCSLAASPMAPNARTATERTSLSGLFNSSAIFGACSLAVAPIAPNALTAAERTLPSLSFSTSVTLEIVLGDLSPLHLSNPSTCTSAFRIPEQRLKPHSILQVSELWLGLRDGDRESKEKHCHKEGDRRKQLWGMERAELPDCQLRYERTDRGSCQGLARAVAYRPGSDNSSLRMDRHEVLA